MLLIGYIDYIYIFIIKEKISLKDEKKLKNDKRIIQRIEILSRRF